MKIITILCLLVPFVSSAFAEVLAAEKTISHWKRQVAQIKIVDSFRDLKSRGGIFADNFLLNSDGSTTIVSPMFNLSGDIFSFVGSSKNINCSDEAIAEGVASICRLAGFERILMGRYRRPSLDDVKDASFDIYYGLMLDPEGNARKICPANTYVSQVVCK